MAVTYNIKGTTNSSFKVGKQGTGTVYAGGLEANNIQATGNLTVTGNLVVSGTTTTVNSTTIDVQNSLRFEGATSDDFETTLTLVDPTADRTITLPNATGTVVLQDTTDTLSNKTLASPAFSGSVSGNVAFDTSTLFVDADNNRIGIGTTSPGRALTIAGGSQAKISFTEGGVQSIYFGDSGAEFAGYIHYNHNSDELRFVTSGTININGAYTLPTADGSAGQVLATDGSDTVSFSSFGFPKDMGAISGSTSSFPVGTAPDFGALSGDDYIGHDFGGLTNLTTKLDNIIEDTTPQLGGDLDAQSNNITAVGKLEVTNTSTDDSILITSTEDSSTAAPVITLKRNSSSPADADYLGQIKFKGENDADQEIVYAKITAKILDASDGTEDGMLEYAFKKGGSNNISARFRGDALQLLNGTNLYIGSTGLIQFEGSTADAYETNLTVAEPTADRTITLPNATGTVALTNSFTHFHSSAQTVTSGQATTNASGTVDYTFSELSGAIHYVAFLNRTLMRASEYSVSGTTLTVNSGVLATDDQIEVTGISV